VRQDPTPLIELVDIEKIIGNETGLRTTVLRGLSLKIYAGEFVAITGASGSGKSTLMNILGCLDRPTSGEYRLAGRVVTDLDHDDLAHLRRSVFGFIFQQYHLLSRLSALDNVAMPGLYAGMQREDRERHASALLERLGLAHRSVNRPNQLSGGQQQRVSIARALMNGGNVILADEPTGALDSRTGEEVMSLLASLAAAGHTVILITHDRHLAAKAPRIIDIRDGQIAADSGARVGGGVSSTIPRISATASTLVGNIEILRSAVFALRANLLRTSLTLLGMIIGVASIMALSGIGLGAQDAVMKQLAVFGVNRLYVIPGGENPRSPGGQLTQADVELVAAIPGVEAAMPYLYGKVTLRSGRTDVQSQGVAVTTDFPKILNWSMQQGSFFTQDDERRLATVAVIGKKVRDELFPDPANPLRQFILVNNVPFQVIGVLSGKGALSGDADDDDKIVFPFSTGSQRIFGTPNLSWISVLLKDLENADATTEAVAATLEKHHRVKDFSVYNRAASIQAQRHTQQTMTLLLALTATISLLVGGIGIMNIMLMTVTERTREIGIRLAIGARPRDILRQFLAEATILSVLGGLAGLVTGIAVGLTAFGFGMPVIFSLHAALGGLLSALFVGITFGFLPARRASLMNPVAALTRE